MADEGAASKEGSPAEPSRKPYVKPAVAWEEALEDRPNLIAACAQRPGEDAACDTTPFSQGTMRIAPDLAWQMVDGEGVIVDLPRRRVLGLNPSGSLIFSLLERATEDEIAAEVALRFNVDVPQARVDVREFLGALEARGFVLPS